MASWGEQQPAGGPLPLACAFSGRASSLACHKQRRCPVQCIRLTCHRQNWTPAGAWGARQKDGWLVCHRYARSCGKQASLSKLARQQTEFISSMYYPVAEQRAAPEKATAPHIQLHTHTGCCCMGVHEGQHRLRHRHFARVAKGMDLRHRGGISKKSITTLMFQKPCQHQLRLVAYPIIIYKGLAQSQVMIAGFSEASKVSLSSSCLHGFTPTLNGMS